MRICIKAALALAMSFAAAATSPDACAQNYPTRPVRIIATSTAGGPQDLLARMLANHLATALGQPFVVENRIGANTIIAAQAVAEAPADGYMLLIGSDATFSINPHLHTKLSYDPDGFVPVALLVAVEQQLFVGSKMPVNSLTEFIAYAKARPGQLNYASMGVGSTPHLATERLMQATGIEMVHVPYKGASEMLPALVGDHVQVSIVALTGALPLLQSGLVKALATGGSKHFPELPGVPTFVEAGYPQLDFKIWFGLMARKGTPQRIIDLLAEQSNKYVTSEEFRNVTAPRNRWTVLGGSQQEFADFLKKDREIYGRAIEYGKIPKLN